MTYADARSDIERALRERGVVTDIAAEVSSVVRLPDDLTIAVGAGSDAPKFTYERREIELPSSFIELVRAHLAEQGYRDERLECGVAEVVAFVVTHELAHALIDVLDLPIAGREEDAADDFASIIAVGYERDERIVTATADFLRSVSTGETDDDTAFFGEHKLGLQRVAAMDCLRYGSDPKAYADEARSAGLSSAQLEQCATRWANSTRSWYRILAPHLRADAR